MIGFICGAVGKYLTPQLKHGDVFTAMTIGLVGSVCFSWLGSEFKLYEDDSFYSLIASFIGASSLVFIYHEYVARYGTPRPPERP